jgi:potassium channel subfamily K, other eukaryote
MASTFNICAVAIDWRLIVDPSNSEAEGSHIPDPTWLIAVNAVSLAIAILANLALMGHMTNRVKFDFAAPAVIGGWLVSGFLDVALVAAAPTHVPLPDNPNATWSQAYYYAIFSAVVYVLLSMMLSVTAFGVWVGGLSSEFKLTLAQRSLMLQTVLFLGYVLCAAAVYSHVENWVYLDAVYFTIVTLFTIGFGDLTPKTHLGRSLFFPFAVGGIVFVGLIVANTRSLVLESASIKVSTRLVEKARYKAIKAGDPSNGVFKVRLKRVDTNGSTELERREKEFNVMREVQTTAAHNNRIFALSMATMSFMILWFIGAVAFWQAEQATGGQNWSYFETVYFVYVAQLTIG